MNENTKNLLELIQQNPDLPIVPMVDAEIVNGDDWGRWMGSFGAARVDEYLIPPQDYDPMLFKSDDDVFDVLEKCLPEAEFDALPEKESECRPVYDKQQQDAGVQEYIWSDSGDSRVRSGHHRLNGKKFRWDDPPVVDERTGRRCHPGEDFQCRCVAIPVFDIDTLDL